MGRIGLLIFEIPTGDEIHSQEVAEKLKKTLEGEGIQTIYFDLSKGVKALMDAMF